jgi:hypothetical protein
MAGHQQSKRLLLALLLLHLLDVKLKLTPLENVPESNVEKQQKRKATVSWAQDTHPSQRPLWPGRELMRA